MKKDKWFNKNKTKCLHTDKISYWHYTGVTEVQSKLDVVVDGYEMSFRGEEADDIYNILHSQKELL